MLADSVVEQVLQELYLLSCSLLPGESMLFSDATPEDRIWEACFESFAESAGRDAQLAGPSSHPTV